MKTISAWTLMLLLCGVTMAAQEVSPQRNEKPKVECRIKKLDPKPSCAYLQTQKQTPPSPVAPKLKVPTLTPKKEWRPPQCRPSKPATMETDAMRRAKVRHRGLPIEGCAPLSPEEHNRRFHAAIQKEKAK